MLIKSADDKARHILKLEALLTRADLGAHQRRNVEVEVRSLRLAQRSQRDSAWVIDTLLEHSRQWAVIHDLRLVHDGQEAHIDHLLINRFLEVFVIDSKHYHASLTLDEAGEFTAWYNAKPSSIASPREQIERHIEVVRALLNQQVLERASLGNSTVLLPRFRGLVLVSKSARVRRPLRSASDDVIKADALRQVLRPDAALSGVIRGGLGGVQASVLPPDVVQDLARQLVALHQPADGDRGAQAGGAAEAPLRPRAVPQAVSDLASQTMRPSLFSRSGTNAGGMGGLERALYVCEACKARIAGVTAKPEAGRRGSAGGKVLCLDCQRAFFRAAGLAP